jgi:hypothetical protein
LLTIARWISLRSMSGKAYLIMLATFAAGAAAGWLAKPDAPAASPRATKSAERNPAARSGREASPQAKAARQWMDRIETSGVREVAKEVPTGDFKSLLEGVMATVWGGMSDKQLEQLVVLIADWAGKDLDGALAWARGLENPKQREVGLVSIAAKVAKTDPKAAFEIYAELDEVTTEAGKYLSVMMRTLYNDAAKQGVEAILDVVSRTPLNKTRSGERIEISYPEGTDFKSLMDGLLAIATPEGKPFEPSNPLGSWGLKDSDAAFAYITLRTSEGQRLELDGMVYELGEKWGTVEAKRWMGTKLASLNPAEQWALLSEGNLLNSPGILRSYIAEMPTAEAADDFRYQVIKFSADRKFHPGYEILNDVPDVQERVAMIERLRDVKDDRGIRMFLKNWEIPVDRIDRIVKTVAQPADP